MDVDRAFRALRLVSLGNRALRGRRKLKTMLDAQAAQNNTLFGTADAIRRVRDKKVTGEDVRAGARLTINNAPKIYRVVVRATRKQGGDEKT